jgi:hypothetical protein
MENLIGKLEDPMESDLEDELNSLDLEEQLEFLLSQGDLLSYADL